MGNYLQYQSDRVTHRVEYRIALIACFNFRTMIQANLEGLAYQLIFRDIQFRISEMHLDNTLPSPLFWSDPPNAIWQDGSPVSRMLHRN